MCPKPLFHVLVSIHFLLGSHVFASDLPQEYQSKIKAVTALWEYEREEFIRLTKLSDDQKRILSDVVVKEQDVETRKSIALLLALNCIEVSRGFIPFAFLQQYRCKNGPFETFSTQSLASISDTYALAFVKERDRSRTMSFLKRYIKFWKDEATKREGVVLGASDVEYLQEILRFLEKGGYQ